MNINKTKNYIILFFVMLAIYQTAKLWFEDFSSHNFFYYLANVGAKDTQIDHNMHTISRIFVNLGNKKFVAPVTTHTDDSKPDPLAEPLYGCIALAAASGTFVGEKAVDYNALLKNKSIIVQFAPSMTLMPKNNLLSPNTIKNGSNIMFDTMIITPLSDASDTANIFFVNSDSGTASEVYVKNKLIESMGTIIADSVPALMDFYYESSAINGFALFQTNVFLDRWSGYQYKYKPLKKENPYTENGDLLLNYIERHVSVFFDNPSTNWVSKVNEIYTYSDENTVVKYYPKGILEYSNYRSDKTTTKLSLYDAYLLAIRFLEKDTSIKNDYYLANYVNKDGQDCFYFNYKIDNFPIEMTIGLKKELEMQSFIEVTVEDQRVTKYKRYVYNFFYGENDNFLKTTYLSAIDKVFASDMHTEDERIKDMFLGFNIDEHVNTAQYQINWLVKTTSREFILKTD